jgi:hypothetical protein
MPLAGGRLTALLCAAQTPEAHDAAIDKYEGTEAWLADNRVLQFALALAMHQVMIALLQIALSTHDHRGEPGKRFLTLLQQLRAAAAKMERQGARRRAALARATSPDGRARARARAQRRRRRWTPTCWSSAPRS